MDKFAKYSFFAQHARRLAADESGATAIEYAMIASGIALAVVAAITALGGSVKGLFQSVANALS